MMTKVKICGLTRSEDIECANRVKPDFVGFVFYPKSKRLVSLEQAAALKAQYEEKLKDIDKEAEAILSEARQKALHNEAKIVEEAKEEAARIIARANEEALLEKKRVVDEMKQEMIAVAAAMASKVISANIDINIQNQLVDETIKEMGDSTWLS